MEEEVEEFEQKISYFSLRHFIRPESPGAQINYPHGVTVEMPWRSWNKTSTT